MEGLRAAAVFLIALGGVVGALGVIWKSRLGNGFRWVWQRLVGNPLEEWHRDSMVRVIEREVMPIVVGNREQLTAIMDEFAPNGGDSVRDQLNRLESGQRKIFARLDETGERLELVEEVVDEHVAAVDK